jgi:hypothetical protein
MPKPSDIDSIKRRAVRFRRAIEQVPEAQRLITMQKFPRDSCGDASLLLGAYFVDVGIKGFRYICGERGSHDAGTWTTHAWLQRGPLVVDITADQFDDAPARVIVEENSAWHEQFELDDPSASDYREWSGPGTYDLPRMYGCILANLGRSDPRKVSNDE